MKRLLILWGCLSMLQTQATPIAELDFQNNSEKLTQQSFNALNNVVLNFYSASDIHLVFHTTKNYQTDLKQKVLMEKRIKEIEEFLLEEHISREIVTIELTEKPKANDRDLIIELNYKKELNERLRVTPAIIHVQGKYNLHFMEIDRSSVESAKINVVEEVTPEMLLQFNSVSSKGQILVIRKLIQTNYSTEYPISTGVEMEFTLSPELSKKKMQLFVWSPNAKCWEPIGSAKTNKNKNELSEYYTQIDISNSGIFAWAEILSGSKLKATVKAPKLKAISSCHYISTAPYIQVSGEISNNESSAELEIPKAYQNGFITCMLTDASGKSEEVNLKIDNTVWNKIFNLFHPNQIQVTFK